MIYQFKIQLKGVSDPTVWRKFSLMRVALSKNFTERFNMLSVGSFRIFTFFRQPDTIQSDD
jgi:hypothetical protein